MKRSILFLTLVAFCVAAMAADNDIISRQWRKTTIKVPDGGQSPNIVTLLKAFDKQFSTYATGRLLEKMNILKDGQDHEADDEATLLIDRRSGYASFMGSGDDDKMETCVWRRTNGHRLFAISLFQQHVMPQSLLCWYDYDPATQTLRPEASPIDEFKTQFKPLLDCQLPRKGSDFNLVEYYDHLSLSITHIYKWDGMRHHYSYSRVDNFRYQWFADGDWQMPSENDYCQYALVDPLGNGYPLLCLRKAKEGNEDEPEYAIFAQFKGDMQTVAISDGMHQFNGLFTVQPEDDAPWKSTDLVAFTRDFMNNAFYVVIRDGHISYFVNDIPFEEDGESGHNTETIGFGGDDESIHIIHANIARKFNINPQWHDCKFLLE